MGVYKGLAAVLGVYVFFFVESMLKLNWAKEAKVKNNNFMISFVWLLIN